MLDASKIWPSNYAPPLLRMLWRFGVEAIPPHFRSFRSNVMFFALYFGPAWGAMMWLGMWRGDGRTSVSTAVVSSVIAGLLFGLAMAAYFRHGCKKHALPAWESLAQ